MFKDLWKQLSKVIESPARVPTAVAIPADHIDPGIDASPFARNQHYFQVRINELFLTHGREWFNQIDPMVFVVSEFTYDRKEQEVPFIVGPGMMQKYAEKLEKLPQGMIFRDTRVAGVHPYRGGRLALTVVLSQVVTANHARELLKVVESTAAALDFSTALSAYVKVGTAVLNGFEALLGLNGTRPIVGLRHEFDSEDEPFFAPGFFALIDEPNVASATLWVRNRQLWRGSSLADAEPYRDADFVLYSVARSKDNKRTELDQLPFNSLWDRVMSEAAVPKDDNWLSAKANMTSLYQALLLSPDLTPAQADDLAEEFRERAKVIHQNAVKNANLGPAARPAGSPALEAVRIKSLSVLED